MEPIIAGRDLRKSWGPTLVLEHADFLIHAGDKIALVGPNGSGKSTLFRLIAGETTLDLGDLVLKPGLRLGYLPQVPNVPPETAVREVLSAPSPEAQRIEAELADLEAWMARPDAWDAADAAARKARYETLHVALGAPPKTRRKKPPPPGRSRRTTWTSTRSRPSRSSSWRSTPPSSSRATTSSSSTRSRTRSSRWTASASSSTRATTRTTACSATRSSGPGRHSARATSRR